MAKRAKGGFKGRKRGTTKNIGTKASPAPVKGNPKVPGSTKNA